MKPQDGKKGDLFRAYVVIERWDNGDDTDPVDISKNEVLTLTDWMLRDEFVAKMDEIVVVAQADYAEDVVTVDEIVAIVDQPHAEDEFDEEGDDEAEDDEADPEGVFSSAKVYGASGAVGVEK